MEAASSASPSPNITHIAGNQLSTFATQHNAMQGNKQIASASISVEHQGDSIQHVTSTGGSIMVIQQPGIPSAVGLVTSATSSVSNASSATVQGSSDPSNLGGLYTTATGLPAEYVLPGTNMISSGSQGYHVHVPVVPQQGGNEDDSNYHDMDDESRVDKDELREQDRFLPIANVARIMKKGIPKQGKIAKDAKECVQECVSEFISFITSEASERCQQEKRKTINGEDILFAMSTLGFDNYVEPLKQYLTKYREAMKGEKGSLNTSNENVRTDVEHTLEESSDSNAQTIQFQVPGTGTAIHPSMVTGEQQTSTIYTYQPQLQAQSLSFQ